jgi:hypothetical protein
LPFDIILKSEGREFHAGYWTEGNFRVLRLVKVSRDSGEGREPVQGKTRGKRNTNV